VSQPDFDQVLQSFYRAPDAVAAVQLFEAWLSSTNPSVIDLHTFTRMAARSEQVRAGIEALRSTKPAVVDAVLKGFDDPAFPRVGNGPPTPEEMDLLWVEFFVTGSTKPVLRLVRILDEPDLARARLTQWLKETGTGFFGKRKLARFLPVFARCMIPVVVEARAIDGPLDVDLSIALAARAGRLKFAELPIPLSQSELVRIAAKSAAVWSLNANAVTHQPVKEVCAVEATRPGGAARVLLASSNP
jgi:hypothetical protein